MKVIFEADQKVPIKAWVDGVDLDEKARDQLIQTAMLPFIHKHLAVMPDAHWGMGSTVGSVIATKGAIVPAAVGVDIGCGMTAVRLPDISIDEVYDYRKAIYDGIKTAVPNGRTDNGGPNDRGRWSDTIPALAANLWGHSLVHGFDDLAYYNPKLNRWGDPVYHLGTLGTGNHFIEVCADETDQVWAMLHSGSRGVGNAIGRMFIKKAQEECELWHVQLPNKDLAYFPEGTPGYIEYTKAVGWAQEYAMSNREVILALTLEALGNAIGHAVKNKGMIVSCHHNYVQKENHFGSNVHVTRKGAVRARKGDLGIIPGAMGRSSYIVEGLGNPDSFHSCSHGAGRIMSRTQARKAFTVEDHVKATEGLECNKGEAVLDETPGAYKDVVAVMAAQKDLVTIKHTLRALVNVKGDND